LIVTFEQSVEANDDQDELLVAPSGWFLPTYDPVHAGHFQTLCLLRSSRRPAGCDDVLRNTPRDDSYTTHHWLHSWADGFVHAGPPINVSRITILTRLIV